MKDTVLLFDLGGVLVENELFAALGAMMSGTLPEAELKARWLASPTVRRYETGAMTDVAFATALVVELGLPMGPAEFIPAFRGWVKGFYPGAIALLGALRRHYRVGCLSNSNALHWVPEYESSFDFSYSSHKTGVIKPDRAAFARVTEVQGLVPAQVLYFDDSNANVIAANAFGFKAHHTVGFGELEQTLTALGILPL